VLTTCSECATSFRVTAAELAVRRGRVRCGVCGSAFDALASLTDTPAGPAPAADLPELATPTDPDRLRAVSLVKDPDVRREAPATHDAIPVPRPIRTGGRGVRTAWRMLVLCAGLALVVQLAPYVADDLATRIPAAAPLTRQLCTWLDCRAVAPAETVAGMFVVTARDVRAHPDVANALLVNVTFRNDSQRVRRLPGLAITVSGEDDEPVARGVFTPDIYLGAAAMPDARIDPGDSLHVVLELAAPARAARGYEIAFVPH